MQPIGRLDDDFMSQGTQRDDVLASLFLSGLIRCVDDNHETFGVCLCDGTCVMMPVFAHAEVSGLESFVGSLYTGSPTRMSYF